MWSCQASTRPLWGYCRMPEHGILSWRLHWHVSSGGFGNSSSSPAICLWGFSQPYTLGYLRTRDCGSAVFLFMTWYKVNNYKPHELAFQALTYSKHHEWRHHVDQGNTISFRCNLPQPPACAGEWIVSDGRTKSTKIENGGLRERVLFLFYLVFTESCWC